MTIPKNLQIRLTNLRRNMAKKKLSALWVGNPENRRYLSGFSASDPQLDESSGRLLITKKHQYLLTDFRYEIGARREAKGFEVVIYRGNPVETLAVLAKKHRISTLGIEADHTTVSHFQDITKALKGRKISAQTQMVELIRQFKDADEIRKMTKALHITEQALDRTFKWLKPGLTEIAVARFLEEAMVELGAEGPAFETIVASGPNAAEPHALASKRKIKASETIIFDCGAKYKGYGSDISRTIILGKAPAWAKNIYSLVRQAQLAAIAGIKPSMKSDQADALARDVIDRRGFGENFGHSLGHGVGLATHEMPSVSRNLKSKLMPGMVITIEPGIYIAGKGGVRLEEMALITEKGIKILNKDKTFYEF